MPKNAKEKSTQDLNNSARPVKLKLREGTNIQPIVAEWIEDIIEGRKVWTLEKIKAKGEEFIELIRQVFQIAIENLVLEDKDKFIEKTDTLLSPDLKRAIWDRNHNTILSAISNLTAERNRFPTRTELSFDTKLTRVTINRHLKEYFESAEHKEKQEEFILMRERVLATAFKYASSHGDMRAAKVFLDATANQQPAMKIENQQNNFVQINNVTITEDQINKLPEDKRKQMKEILFMLTEK